MEETTESVNPMDLDPSVSSPFEPVRGEHDVPVKLTEAMFKIYQDMAMVQVWKSRIKLSFGLRNCKGLWT